MKKSFNTYLVLIQNDKILLHLRHKTGYFDGHYGLVSGHIEDGETALQGIIREAHEEAGILLNPNNLRMIHVMHRKSDRLNVDFFFECKDWDGTPTNREPEKCRGLEFFPLDSLPGNTIPYIASFLGGWWRRELGAYSEVGWE